MLPILIKDLFENMRTWFLFLFASGISNFLASAGQNEAVAQGLTQGLLFGGGLIFAHNVIFAERRRRHLLLLKSLPITDTQILGAKFLSALILTLSLAGSDRLCKLLIGVEDSHPLSLLYLSLTTLYLSVVLGLYICFRNPALPFLPLYMSASLALWGKTRLEPELHIGTETVVISSLLISLLIYGTSLAVFKRKELDF